MGFYRFFLAVFVVLFHFSAFSTLSGYSAIFGFYLLSGFIIAQVLDKIYLKSQNGVGSFYINRFLRIYPLYLFYVLAMYACIVLHRGTGFLVKPNAPAEYTYLISKEIVAYSWLDVIKEALFNYYFSIARFKLPAVLYLNAFPQIVPPAWSLCSEFVFYISAPFVVMSLKSQDWKKYLTHVLCAVFALYTWTTSLLNLEFSTYRYRSVYGAYFVFLIGVLIYHHRDQFPKLNRPFLWFWGFFSCYFALLMLNRVNFAEYVVYITMFIQVLITITLTQVKLNNLKIRFLEQFFGKLSYGVFLGHFLAAFTAFAITEFMLKRFSISNPFGTFGSANFVIVILIFTVIFATGSYYAVEYPIELLRKKVRQRVSAKINV